MDTAPWLLRSACDRGVAGEVVRDEQAINVFYFGLALIVVGVGLLKPNISTVVGRLYGENDPRRDGGFTIFYMGINIGAASASLLCGWLASAYGWAYGFGAAGIGMLIGLIIFSLGQHWLEGHGDPSDPEILKQPAPAAMGLLNVERTIVLYSLLSVLVVWVVLQSQGGVGLMLPVVAALFLAWFIWLLATQCNTEERGKMGALFFLIVISTVFWSMFEQSGGSMTLFADRATDLTLFGAKLTAHSLVRLTQYLLSCSRPCSLSCGQLLSNNIEPSTPAKFGFGIIQVGLGFGALLIGLNNPDSAGLVSAWWLVLAYFLHTSAELCLSPIGLSAVTKLSIARYVGVMMGAWFLASAYGSYLASELAIFFSSIDGTGDGRLGLDGFTALFTELLLYGVGVGVVVLAVSPFIRRMMRDVH